MTSSSPGRIATAPGADPVEPVVAVVADGRPDAGLEPIAAAEPAAVVEPEPAVKSEPAVEPDSAVGPFPLVEPEPGTVSSGLAASVPDDHHRVASLSPSRASDFMTCPLLYRFRVIDRLPERPSRAATRGTLVHAVLEALFDLPSDQRTLPRATGLLPEAWQRLLDQDESLQQLFDDEPEHDGDAELPAESLVPAEAGEGSDPPGLAGAPVADPAAELLAVPAGAGTEASASDRPPQPVGAPLEDGDPELPAAPLPAPVEASSGLPEGRSAPAADGAHELPAVLPVAGAIARASDTPPDGVGVPVADHDTALSGAPTVADAAEGASADPHGPVSPPVAAFLAEAEDLLGRYFTLEDPSRLEPAERELLVSTPLPSGLLLRGIVDRIDVAPGGQVRVVDYKTGQAPGEVFEAKALFQMKFYALVLWRLRGTIPAMLQLVYLGGEGTLMRYQPEEGDLLATERKLDALWKAIERAYERREFLPSPSRLCSWCDHHALCPAFDGTPPPLPDPLPVPALEDEQKWPPVE